MKYFAPVTNFIPKSTFQTRINIPYLDQQETTGGLYGIPLIAESDLCYFAGMIPPSIYEVIKVGLVLIPNVNANNMKISLVCNAGQNGADWDTHQWNENYNIASTFAFKVLILDLTTQINFLTSNDLIKLRCTYYSGALATNLYVNSFFVDCALI